PVCLEVRPLLRGLLVGRDRGAAARDAHSPVVEDDAVRRRRARRGDELSWYRIGRTGTRPQLRCREGEGRGRQIHDDGREEPAMRARGQACQTYRRASARIKGYRLTLSATPFPAGALPAANRANQPPARTSAAGAPASTIRPLSRTRTRSASRTIE